MYQYRANVIDVHDGDTMHLKVDLGCDIAIKMTVRLHGINAPELSTAAGKASRDYAKSLLPADKEVWIQTIKDQKEKYGRYLGRIFLDRASMEGNVKAYCINDMLVATGHAVAYMAATPAPTGVRQVTPAALGTAKNSVSAIDLLGVDRIVAVVQTTTTGKIDFEATPDDTNWHPIDGYSTAHSSRTPVGGLTPTSGMAYEFRVHAYRGFRIRVRETLGSTVDHMFGLYDEKADEALT